MKKFLFLLISFGFLTLGWCQHHEYIKQGNNIIHITTYGEGDPVLIINGGPGMHSSGFHQLAQKLSKNRRTILYDQRGTGQSTIEDINSTTITMGAMVQDIEVIRKHLQLEHWVVLGHSFGGILASYYASEFPKRIKGLILSSSGGINMDLFSRLNITARLSQADRDSLRYWNSKIAAGDTTYNTRLKRGMFLAPAYVYNKKNIPLVADRLTQGNSLINGLVHRDMRNINFDCSENLGQLKVPVLIIQGKEDLVDMETAETTKKALPQSQLVIMENCGHYGWLDRPDLYYSSIEDFLETLHL